MMFGEAAELEIDLEGVKCIIDFDADLLGSHPTAVRNARQFAEGRDPHHEMSRLWVVEPTWSVTGMAADHRRAESPDGVSRTLIALANALQDHPDLPNPGALGPSARAEISPELAAFVAPMAEDLMSHAGHGLVAVGAGQGIRDHELAMRLNLALGNRAVRARRLPAALSRGTLLPEFDPAAYDTVLVLGADLFLDEFEEMAEKIRGVDCSIYLGARPNATSEACSWVLPMTHALEEWGDAVGPDASLCLRQPLIAPLLGGRSDLTLLAQFAALEQNDFQTVQETYAGIGADRSWREALHAGSATIDVATELTVPVTEWRSGSVRSRDGLQIHTYPDRKVRDGRYANNAWLQELPDPVTKLTWGNAALFAPATADQYGIRHGDIVRLTTDRGSVEIPAMVLPGQNGQTVSVAYGYGRRFDGRVGRDVGVSAFAMNRRGAVTVEKTGRTAKLATTQDHWAIDPRGKQERSNRIGMLVREGTVTELREHPEFVEHRGIHHPPLRSLWEERTYEDAAWAMAIDLNKCTGCSACVVACVAENNIPVVGADQVSRGREMQWLRIDRYFAGEPADPTVANQPMACVHCEMAPCEQVCPVGATMHSAEGLNVMAYNRCVGTRYCSNNCPYKVRRFNFYEYNDDLTDLELLVKNPEVSVRSRGVMEKCTYCVQRIEHARINAKNQGRPIADGEIQPACQQTCPSQAITFGDLNQEGSRVAELHADHRSYEALGELNLKPRTRYLARIRNPHPALAAEEHHGEEAHGEEVSHG
jgi:molybdopterin-containing oxidoreductase family iron-sulfur binding subunit